MSGIPFCLISSKNINKRTLSSPSPLKLLKIIAKKGQVWMKIRFLLRQRERLSLILRFLNLYSRAPFRENTVLLEFVTGIPLHLCSGTIPTQFRARPSKFKISQTGRISYILKTFCLVPGKRFDDKMNSQLINRLQLLSVSAAR